MTAGKLVGIYTAPTAGAPMQRHTHILAIEGRGLKEDRYCEGAGSFNKKSGPGNRQVTVMNIRFLPQRWWERIITGNYYRPEETRRNLFTEDFETFWHIGRTFKIGGAKFRGTKYCEPCNRPRKLSGRAASFADLFVDCGCILAEVVEGGTIQLNDLVIPSPKDYGPA